MSEAMEITIERMAIQLKSLEVQLKVLKTLMKRTQTTDTTCSFASLYGILKGQCESREEDIAAVEYRLEWGNE